MTFLGITRYRSSSIIERGLWEICAGIVRFHGHVGGRGLGFSAFSRSLRPPAQFHFRSHTIYFLPILSTMARPRSAACVSGRGMQLLLPALLAMMALGCNCQSVQVDGSRVVEVVSGRGIS